MNIIQAAFHLKGRRKIRRKGWSNDSFLKMREDGVILCYRGSNNYIEISQLLAEDWEVIE